MCGRFTFEHEWPAFIDLYDLPWQAERGRNTEARFNIAPTQSVLMAHSDADGAQMAEEAVVAFPLLGEGDAEGGHVQCAHRNGRYGSGLSRCVQEQAMSDPGFSFLRVDA